MSAIFMGDPEHESPEWIANRAKGIGGSEIASIVGLSPWESPFALWHRKAGNIGPKTQTQSMNWGQRLESAIVQAWCERHPELTPAPGGMFRNEERPWQIGSPDHVVEDGVLEVKTADKYAAWEWGPSGSDEYPPYYRCQGLWYGDTLGLQRVYLAVLIGGNDYREYEITPEPGEIEHLRAAGEAFWTSLQNGTPPPLDESEHTYEAIRELHPEIDGTEVQVDADDVEAWRHAAAEIKRLKGVEANSKSKVAEQMGNARHGLIGDEKAVVRQTQGSGRPFPKLIPLKKKDKAA